MAQKIKAIKQAAPSLIVVARTDARAQEGLAAAIKRSEAYIEAGADAIFRKRYRRRMNSASLLSVSPFRSLRI